MQEPNNENTIPTEPQRGGDQTMPTPIRAQNTNTSPTPETTQPVTTSVPVQSTGGPPFSDEPPVTEAAPRKPRRWLLVLAGILLVIILGGAGTYVGYLSGLNMRVENERSTRTLQATEHFMLGMQAQENKQWEIAKAQYEYVIKLDPTFPGASDKLREVLIEQMTIATPTPIVPTATPTPEPTRDLRPLEDIYNTIRAQYAAQEWDNFFASVDSLRTTDPAYKAVEVDGMIYFALRFRGIDKILYRANLEGGLYDLAVAELYGPLDVDAQNYRLWARQYLNGTRFWEIDWLKVMEYFEDIYLSFPNLRDGSGLTAIERYRIAASEHANRLVAQGQYCDAMEYYEKSMSAVPDGNVAATATAVWQLCATATPTLAPATPTPTITLTVVAPVVTPTFTPTTGAPPVDPTATNTVPAAEPTVTPTPTETPTS